MSESAAGPDILGIVKVIATAIGSAFVGAFGGHTAATRKHADYGQRILQLELGTRAEKARVTAALRELHADLAADRGERQEMHKQNREDIGEMRKSLADLVKEIRDLWKARSGRRDV